MTAIINNRLLRQALALTGVVGLAYASHVTGLELRPASLPEPGELLRYAVGSLFLLGLAWYANRMLNACCRQLGWAIPVVIRTLVSVAVFLVALLVIVLLVFDVPLTMLWGACGAVGIFGGFAFQEAFSDTFAGIVLNIQRPFRIGDWVRLKLPGQDEIIGEILEIDWRRTQLGTVDKVVIVVPNRQIAETVVTNFSRPDRRSRFSLPIHLDFCVPVEDAIEVLSAAVNAAEGLLDDPAPRVRVDQIRPEGTVVYNLDYWLNVEETSPRKGRHVVSHNVLQHLHAADISPAYEKHVQIRQFETST